MLELLPLQEIFKTDPYSEPSQLAIDLQSVSVAFGGLRALNGVSVKVEQHATVAVVGPNGAGKSTLLNAINGLVPSQGKTNVFGHQLENVPAAKRVALGIGRSFQDPQLLEGYTVLQNVLAGAHVVLNYGLWREIFRPRSVRALEHEMSRRAATILEFMGLGAQLSRRVDELPYGARKLVDIARAMVAGPRVLLLDEPSSGLDAEERSHLEVMLKRVSAHSLVTVLFVEHHMDLVRSVASQVVGMQAGEVLAYGSPDEVLDSDSFREAVIGASRSDNERIGYASRSKRES